MQCLKSRIITSGSTPASATNCCFTALFVNFCVSNVNRELNIITHCLTKARIWELTHRF